MSIFKDTDYAELGQTFAAACQKADNAHAKTVTLQHEHEKRQKRERRSTTDDQDKNNDIDLAEMNEQYAVTKIGGKTRVMSMEASPIYPDCKIPVFSSVQDFCSFHLKRKKTIYDAKGNTKKIGIGRWWIDHSERRQYDGVVYDPAGTNPATFNLWTGFGCTPVEGDCHLYLEHLKQNVCDGNVAYYQYLLRWMAYGVQSPGLPGEVAVVMRGKEGVGKGVAAKEYGRLFGSHFRHVVHAKHLVGHFNSHLQQCAVLFADEAFFAGDRSHESTLKALITEETLLVEPKGVDAFAVKNCIHLIMSSNADWVIPASADARRFFMLNVSDARKQDTRYFGAIIQEMENGGREALLHHLLNLDLMNFNVAQVPQTGALAEQKAFSRRGIDRLIEQIAHDGRLPSAHSVHANIAVTTGEEDARGFYHQARTLVPDLRYDSSIVIANKLKEWGCVPWKSGYQRGISFPPLTELRARFEAKHGLQDWPGGSDGGGVDWESV